MSLTHESVEFIRISSIFCFVQNFKKFQVLFCFKLHTVINKTTKQQGKQKQGSQSPKLMGDFHQGPTVSFN